ncbi:hypothetical protein BDR04DRAFT_1093056 [Suillus decipiens]|nr:hypothetical protein BDR04DRAFT_1093056 [Suillus decipiens]
MGKFCGYLLGEEWLFQRGIELGYPCPKTRDDEMQIFCLASRDVRTETGVYTYTKLRRVKTLQGKRYWCIAFAATDPYEHLPTTAPPEEKYIALKEALKKDGPPRWFRGI